MSEPDLIRSNAPHSVSVSQRSKIAGGEKSTDHFVRKTLAGEGSAPVQPETPELKLSPRIAPTEAALVDLPPPVQAAEDADAWFVLPPAFQPDDEPEGSVLLDQRSIQDNVQRVDELPEQAQASEATTALLPEAVENAESLDEAHAFESSGQDHRVSLPEPLPVEEAQLPGEAPVLMRSEQDHLVEVPEALADGGEPAEAEAPVLVRSQLESMATVPELPATGVAADGPLIPRHQDEHFATVPPADDAAPEPAAGPVISRAQTDTLVAVPEGSASEAADEGLTITRSVNDQLVAVPEAVAEAESGMVLAPERPELDMREAALRSSEEIIEIVEVPEGEAPPDPAEPAAEQPAPEPRLSAQAMVLADFPARVVKLKIANDKVRAQLDALEALGRPRS